MADRCNNVASLLIGMISSLLTLLQAHLTLLRRHLDFERREQDILRLITFDSFEKKEDKRTLAKPAKTSKVLDKTWTNFSMVGQLCR